MIWGALWCFTPFRLTVQKLSAGQYLIIENQYVQTVDNWYWWSIIGIIIDQHWCIGASMCIKTPLKWVNNWQKPPLLSGERTKYLHFSWTEI